VKEGNGGRFRNIGKIANEWDGKGAFSSKTKAISACTVPEHFIGPLNIDEILPDEIIDWPGCEYPLIGREKEKKES